MTQDAPDRIDAFRDAVRRLTGSWWAPASQLPCPADQLQTAILSAREDAYARRDMAEFRSLTALLADLTLFVDDELLAVMSPFFTHRGRITGRSFEDPEQVAARDRAYATYTALIDRRRELLPYLDATDGGLHAAIGTHASSLHITPPRY